MRFWATAAAACFAASSALALTPFTLTPKGFGELAPAEAASDLIVSHFRYSDPGHEPFYGTAVSQAFHLQDGNYLYLYQVINESAHVIEQVQVGEFYSPSLARAGYLSDVTGLTLDSPAAGYDGFIAGGKLPPGQTYHDNVRRVSYQYLLAGNYVPPAIPAGQTHWTPVLFLVSPNAPTDGILQVIDGGTATMPTVVARAPEEQVAQLPEPLTLSALGLSLLAAGAYTRRRARD